MAQNANGQQQVFITALLKRLWPVANAQDVTAAEIAAAVSLIFDNRLSPVQSGALLTALHFTGMDREADVLARCAQAMRQASAQVDHAGLRDIVRRRGRREGHYNGGLCDIVGTGGDSHNTFNISTTASVIASSLLLIAKHGNRASTSKSGSADLLQSTQPLAPILDNITPATLTRIYEECNYAFLFAPIFHPGMRFVGPIRKELGWRTIFNLLGPLSNPVDSANDTTSAAATTGDGESLLEARVIGVARRDLGPNFADALRLSGSRKAMVVCGDEELDEISCAGSTHCWRLQEPSSSTSSSATSTSLSATASNPVEIQYFTLTPQDFGFPSHPLSDVKSGQSPEENAKVFSRILHNQVQYDDPLLHFVLINAATLFVVSGVCDADSSAMGDGDDGAVILERGPGGGRWKEGVRRARWALEHGAALREWDKFIAVTHKVGQAN